MAIHTWDKQPKVGWPGWLTGWLAGYGFELFFLSSGGIKALN